MFTSNNHAFVFPSCIPPSLRRMLSLPFSSQRKRGLLYSTLGSHGPLLREACVHQELARLPCPFPAPHPPRLSPREASWAGDQSGGEKQAGPPLAVAGSSWMPPSCGSKAPQVRCAVCERAVSSPNRHVSPDICCLGCTFVCVWGGGPSSGPAVPALFIKHGTKWVPGGRISGDVLASPEPPS